jgi:hypothetical protein
MVPHSLSRVGQEFAGNLPGLTVWGGHRWSEATSKVFDLVAEFAEHESLSRPYSQ